MTRSSEQGIFPSRPWGFLHSQESGWQCHWNKPSSTNTGFSFWKRTKRRKENSRQPPSLSRRTKNPCGLFITKCVHSNPAPKRATFFYMSHQISPLLEQASLTQPRLTGFYLRGRKRSSFYFYFFLFFWLDSSSDDFLTFTIYWKFFFFF